MLENRKGRIELSNTELSFWANGKPAVKIGKSGVTAKKVTEKNQIDSEVIKKYKGKPVWVAFDIDDNPVTYEGCISSNVECDFINAHSFIMAQLIKVDSISNFAEMMGEDAHGVEFLRLLNKNDRNLEFWENLAVKWMGEQDDQ